MKKLLIAAVILLTSCTKNYYQTDITENYIKDSCNCEYVLDTAFRDMNYKEVQIEGLWWLRQVTTETNDGNISTEDNISKDAIVRLKTDAVEKGYYIGESGIEYFTELTNHNNFIPIKWKYDFQLKRLLISDVCDNNTLQIQDLKLRKDSITLFIDGDTKRTLLLTRIP